MRNITVITLLLVSTAAHADDSERFLATSLGGFICDECGAADSGGAVNLEVGQSIADHLDLVIDADLLADTDLTLRGALTAGMVGRMSRLYGRLAVGVGRKTDGTIAPAFGASIGLDIVRAPEHTIFIEQRALAVGKEATVLALAGVRWEQ